MAEREEQENSNNIIIDEEISENNSNKNNSQPMGDVYDVYAKASSVHSRISGMTEDYTLTRYNIDIYNQRLPKFIREQRKILRIIKSFIIIPNKVLEEHYNSDEKVKEIKEALEKEYKIVEELLLGELDECVIMGRTPEGQIIDGFLKHGLNNNNQEAFDIETESPSVGNRLKERS